MLHKLSNNNQRHLQHTNTYSPSVPFTHLGVFLATHNPPARAESHNQGRCPGQLLQANITQVQLPPFVNCLFTPVCRTKVFLVASRIPCRLYGQHFVGVDQNYPKLVGPSYQSYQFSKSHFLCRPWNILESSQTLNHDSVFISYQC